MKCTTVLHGGVCHRISTPHKRGKKMKGKKKKINIIANGGHETNFTRKQSTC